MGKYRPAYNGEKRNLSDNVDFLTKSIVDRGQTGGPPRTQVDVDVFTEKEKLGYVYHNMVKLVKGKGLKEKESFQSTGRRLSLRRGVMETQVVVPNGR